jgi:hypothetical protein
MPNSLGKVLVKVLEMGLGPKVRLEIDLFAGAAPVLRDVHDRGDLLAASGDDLRPLVAGRLDRVKVRRTPPTYPGPVAPAVGDTMSR